MANLCCHPFFMSIFFHRFTQNTNETPLPECFTNPFNYEPHPLVLLAKEQLTSFVNAHGRLRSILQEGKMLGVLIVRNRQGELGFLAGYSGRFIEQIDTNYFVPMIFDPNTSEYYQEKNKEIIEISQRIADKENTSLLTELQNTLRSTTERWQQKIGALTQVYKESKAKRKLLREAENIDMLDDLSKESKFQKSQIKQAKILSKREIDAIAQKITEIQTNTKELKQLRTFLSNSLQAWIFSQCLVFNAKGYKSDLVEIFSTTPSGIAPSGAGDCAMPKMLNYAYQHSLTPLCVGEFWVGESPRSIIRRDGEFYGACSGKCKPILGFMLDGLKVDKNPLSGVGESFYELEILYKDEDLIAINKPSGLLSQPGLVSEASVVSLLVKLYPELGNVLVIHRLDMDTSGVLLFALNAQAQKDLQRQFAQREVQKEYIAVLDGVVKQTHGHINLPLIADYENRPYQVVDHNAGKPSHTIFTVLGIEDCKTRVKFYPQTGRTHQLRVHSAHPEGIGVAICGDPLYGTKGERLLLHASKLKFEHPSTQKTIRITCPPPF